MEGISDQKVFRVGLEKLGNPYLGLDLIRLAKCGVNGFPLGLAIEWSRRSNMADPAQDRCGKCGADIDASRRIDFTLKDGTRVCDSCFVRGTASPTRPDGKSV